MIVDRLDNWIYFAITSGGAILSALLVWLIVISKNNSFSHSDVEAHSSDSGHVVKEGHGPLLPYLWVIFISVLVFAIVYWVLNWPALPTTNTF
jgi:hypothetical protein